MSLKAPKVMNHSDDEEIDEEDNDELEVDDEGGEEQEEDDEEDEGEQEEDDGKEEDREASLKEKKAKVVKPMSKKSLRKLKEDLERTGVVYLSRVPPFMQVAKLRHLLSQYGDVGRIYLRKEDSAITRRREKFKKVKGSQFTDGWVEFLNKKRAKKVALMLNAQKIGGKKRSKYYDDLWNLKYLKGFKWKHLSEKIAYERTVRADRIRNELSEAKREARDYIETVEKANDIQKAQERKQKRQLAAAGGKEASKNPGKSAADKNNNKNSKKKNPKKRPASVMSTTDDDRFSTKRFRQRSLIAPPS